MPRSAHNIVEAHCNERKYLKMLTFHKSEASFLPAFIPKEIKNNWARNSKW